MQRFSPSVSSLTNLLPAADPERGLQTADKTARAPCPGRGQRPGGKRQEKLFTEPPEFRNWGVGRKNPQP